MHASHRTHCTPLQPTTAKPLRPKPDSGRSPSLFPYRQTPSIGLRHGRVPHHRGASVPTRTTATPDDGLLESTAPGATPQLLFSWRLKAMRPPTPGRMNAAPDRGPTPAHPWTSTVTAACRETSAMKGHQSPEEPARLVRVAYCCRPTATVSLAPQGSTPTPSGRRSAAPNSGLTPPTIEQALLQPLATKKRYGRASDPGQNSAARDRGLSLLAHRRSGLLAGRHEGAQLAGFELPERHHPRQLAVLVQPGRGGRDTHT